jgi:hypothetical protein
MQQHFDIECEMAKRKSRLAALTVSHIPYSSGIQHFYVCVLQDKIFLQLCTAQVV